MTILQGKTIILGVTGSIACYKAIDLASKLTQAGAKVELILTEAAKKFVTPLTFRSVTGRAVWEEMWADEAHIPQVQLGESADLFAIIPASAHTIAKLAMGQADNLLTLTALAARCPLLVAPAMDGGMYAHPAVQANLATLRQRGVTIIEPVVGRMASGLVGQGRLPESAELLGYIRLALGQAGPLKGQRVIVSAGPTEEPLDPARYLTNRSSGKQGLAVAQAALDLGAEVTLIVGPICEPLPVGARVLAVRTAQEMHDAILQEIVTHGILVMAAAVADFRPSEVATHKIKKEPHSTSAPTLTLIRNPDILSAVRDWCEKSAEKRFVVGFAAETHDLLQYGRGKLQRKGLDLIAINDISGSNTGFSVPTNQLTLIAKSGEMVVLPLQSKEATAQALWNLILSLQEA